MSRLSLIRFATYAVLLFAVFSATRMHYVIPLKLPFLGIGGDRWTDPSIWHRGAASPTLLPGFADTRLSGSEITRIAEARVAKENIDPAKLSWMRIVLAQSGQKLVWIVTWDTINASPPHRSDFRVTIVDSTGKASFERTEKK